MNTIKDDLYSFCKHCSLFFWGGFLYYIIESTYKGITSNKESHWTMFVVGGLCFVAVGLINEYLSWDMALWKQMLIGTIVITAVEFISGIVINIILGWDVWDYSNISFNILGQICLPFCAIWYILSLAAIYFDDLLRYVLFDEEIPHYTLF